MYYEIIASGKGNCVIINDVMVDCGVEFGEIRTKLFDIKYLLLTHRHGDHINLFTLHCIKRIFPNIVIIGNSDVNEYVGVDKVATHRFGVTTDDYVFEPFDLKHSVQTTGYTWRFQGSTIIYATDTYCLGNAPEGRKYDYFFLESNHDIYAYQKAKQWAAREGRLPFTECDNHLSRQEAYAFYEYYQNNEDSTMIELHKSLMFYDRDSFEKRTKKHEGMVAI